MTLLDQIDRTIAGLCPCGAEPRGGSAYCSYDCEPTHISDDTEAPDCETARPGVDYDNPRYAPPTPMRWRPDLVCTADDTDLIPLGSQRHGYDGRFNAQVYERASDPTTWHLRLDDGNLLVGCDLRDVGDRHDPISLELVGRIREAWQRLELKLTDTRDKVPAADDDARALLNFARARRAGRVHVPFPAHGLHRELAGYHSPPSQVAEQALAGVAAGVRAATRVVADLKPALESFLAMNGFVLTDWQRQVLLDMDTVVIVTPRRTGRSPIQWLPNETWAALNQPGPATPRARPVPLTNQQEPPADPMARAMWLRKRRNTGPPAGRLDGRPRRR